MKYSLVLLWAAVPLLCGAQSANWDGELLGTDPTYNRTLENGSALSLVGTAVHYNVQPFYVALNGPYTFELSAQDNRQDTFAFVYNLFNPAAPLVGYVGGNDDWNDLSHSKVGEGWGNPTALVLQSYTQYYAITTTFNNGETFRYDNVIKPVGSNSGQVILGLVPEPGTAAGLAVALALCLRRRVARR